MGIPITINRGSVFKIAVVVVFFCSASSAQQSSRDENTQETKTGTISGRIVNESGQPLANALVFIRAFGSTGPGRSTASDEEGGFQVSGLDPAAYLVSASVPAYTAAPRDPDSTQPTYFRVGDSVKIELIKGGVITGTVTTSTGEPVVVVRVRAYMIRDGNNQPSRYAMPFREGTTDDRGIYRIYGLPPGTYIISAGGNGNYSNFNEGPYDSDVPTFAPSSSRDTATEINVHPGEETNNIDIRYRGELGHSVSGTASGAVAGAESGVTVVLSSIFNGASQTGVSVFQPPGARGFAFYGIADGDYDLTAQSFVPGGAASVSEPRRIKVRGADLTGIELITKPLGSISGHVALEESKVPECKGKRRPVFAETVVTPWHNEKNAAKDQPQFFWSFGTPTLPDKQGDFTLRNLVPGQYRFNTRVFAKYWYLRSISLPSVASAGKNIPANRSVDAARNWTTVKSGERIPGLTITLAEGAASFHGQIKMPDGQMLLPRMFIYLVPAESEKAEDILRFFASQVAPDGTFALNNLPPGRYWVLAKPALVTESNILSKLRLPDESDARARLRQEAETAKIETDLKPCQNVTDYQLQFGSPAKVLAQ